MESNITYSPAAEPMHLYYGEKLDISTALLAPNAVSCPIRFRRERQLKECKIPIGEGRTLRIIHLLEDLHFHKSLLSDTTVHNDNSAVAPVARISSLIMKQMFCYKHRPEEWKSVAKLQFDRIYAKALECTRFQDPHAGRGDRDFEGITRMLQADNAQTPARRNKGKHARQQEEQIDMSPPLAPKKPCLSSSSAFPPSDNFTGEDLPFWMGFPCPSMTNDSLQQPLVDVNTVYSQPLQWDSLRGNDGHYHQASATTDFAVNRLLTPVSSQSDDMSKQHSLLPQQQQQQASPSVVRVARFAARAGGGRSFVGDDFHDAGGGALGNHEHHQAGGAGICGDMTTYNMNATDSLQGGDAGSYGDVTSYNMNATDSMQGGGALGGANVGSYGDMTTYNMNAADNSQQGGGALGNHEHQAGNGEKHGHQAGIYDDVTSYNITAADNSQQGGGALAGSHGDMTSYNTNAADNSQQGGGALGNHEHQAGNGEKHGHQAGIYDDMTSYNINATTMTSSNMAFNQHPSQADTASSSTASSAVNSTSGSEPLSSPSSASSSSSSSQTNTSDWYRNALGEDIFKELFPELHNA